MPDRTEQAQRPSVRLPVAARVLAIGPSRTHAETRLTRGTCVVGSSADADLVLSDPKVSRRHVELSLVPEGVQVEDLASRNGTFYLGNRVGRITLAFGSEMQVGDTTLRFEADPTSWTTPRSREGPPNYRGLLTVSPRMRELFGTLERLEGSLVNVLLQGESGVGKELIARAIHTGSKVGDKPFVAINCGALPRELVASELFGHRRGAFTGAVDTHRGAFEQAEGGTLFLDEIGELPLDVQPMLLRALESGEVRVVGGESTRTLSVRIIAATNRTLADEVRGGRFREDLFFRLAVVQLVVPSLRERREDIPLLASTIAESLGVAPLDPETLQAFAARVWPGNIRELRNAIEAFAAVGALPPGIDPGAVDDLERLLERLVDSERPYAEQKEMFLARFTRVYLRLVMKRADDNQTEAARLAQLDRGHLRRMLSRYLRSG